MNINIRDPNTYSPKGLSEKEKYIAEVKVLRAAIIYAFNFVLDNKTFVRFDLLDGADKERFSEALKTENFPDIQTPEISSDIFEFINKTIMNCGLASRLVIDYLQTHHSDLFECHIVTSVNELSHFPDHDIATVKSTETGRIYATSPANLFNPDFSIPNFKNSNFNRATDILYADDLETLMGKIVELEAGIWGDLKPITKHEIRLYFLNRFQKDTNVED